MLLCIRCHKATVLKCNVLNRCPVLRILVAGNIYIIAISLPRSLRFNDGSMSMHTNTTWWELIYLSRRKENNSKSVTISCIVWWTGLKWHLFLFFFPGVIGHAHPQAPKPWWLQIMLLCCFVFLWRGACTSAHVPVPPLSNRWGEVGEVRWKRNPNDFLRIVYTNRGIPCRYKDSFLSGSELFIQIAPQIKSAIYSRDTRYTNQTIYYTTLPCKRWEGRTSLSNCLTAGIV